jgi:Xaa-Pro dipeptidase
METQDLSTYIPKRQEHLVKLLREDGLDGMALNPGPSLVYLSGLHFHLSERPVVMVFPRKGVPAIVLPQLEALKVTDLPYKIEVFSYEENPATWTSAFKRALNACGLDQGQLGIEPRRLRALELDFLRDAAPSLAIQAVPSVIAKLRILKDPIEVRFMEQAVEVAQHALSETLPLIKEGINERALANELTIQLLKAGSAPEMPFSPIVAFGENSANPHAFPTERILGADELILIDWGANVAGYYSDITRMFVKGRLPLEFQEIGQVVSEANAAARAVAGPGVSAGEVDRAARQLIEQAGFGPYFTHRTGHGLGMDGHEAPYIRDDNEELLSAGMTFTIEPGIYLAGRGGVRIEDDMLVTQDGVRSLTNMPRTIIPI